MEGCAGFFFSGKAREERRRERTSVRDRLRDERNAARGKKDKQGAVAQLGEHLLCKQRVAGSIPAGSTIYSFIARFAKRTRECASQIGCSLTSWKVLTSRYEEAERLIHARYLGIHIFIK